MSFRDQLSDPAVVNSSQPGPPCKIGTLLSETHSPMPAEDREFLRAVLDADPRSPGHKSVNAIVKALRADGYDANKTCVANHRRRECRCFGTSPKV